MRTPTVICCMCKEPSAIMSGDLRKEDALFNGQRITITFYTCPACRNEYVVQLDSDVTKYMMTEYVKALAQLSEYKGPSKKYLDRAARLADQLEKKRAQLVLRYQEAEYLSVGLTTKRLDFRVVAQIY